MPMFDDLITMKVETQTRTKIKVRQTHAHFQLIPYIPTRFQYQKFLSKLYIVKKNPNPI